MKRDYQALALANSLDTKRFMKGGAKSNKVPETFAVSTCSVLEVTVLMPDRHDGGPATTLAGHYAEPRCALQAWSDRSGRCAGRGHKYNCQEEVWRVAVETDGQWQGEGVEEEDQVVVARLCFLLFGIVLTSVVSCQYVLPPSQPTDPSACEYAAI